jgi:hypothetical protein
MSVAQNVSFQAIVTDPIRAPEPGTMALFGIGLIGIGTAVWQRLLWLGRKGLPRAPVGGDCSWS